MGVRKISAPARQALRQALSHRPCQRCVSRCVSRVNIDADAGERSAKIYPALAEAPLLLRSGVIEGQRMPALAAEESRCLFIGPPGS